MEEDIKKLQQRVNELENQINKLRTSASIPFDVYTAFRERFKDVIDLKVSTKSLNSEDVTVVSSVNFAGSSVVTTTVLDDPDAWLQFTKNGIVYYIAAYTS